jgi:4a-hydroxytetrahydrobiopterin dehydratase
MSRPSLLSNELLQEYCKDVPLWRLEENTIVREIALQNFVAVIGIVNAIAIQAETLDHHPDLHIFGWNKLRITLSTHDKGGLTELDFVLAKKIDTFV